MIGILAQAIGVPDNLPDVTADSGSLQTALNIAFAVAAGVAFIYTIVSAIRFSISAGNPQDVANARRSLIYSVVGLVVSVMALAIVTTVNQLATDVADAGGNPITGPNGILAKLGEWLIAIVGVISVIMLLVGSIRYITSAGQPQSAEAARNTIIYAIVGLVISLIAGFIVGFVLDRL